VATMVNSIGNTQRIDNERLSSVLQSQVTISQVLEQIVNNLGNVRPGDSSSAQRDIQLVSSSISELRTSVARDMQSAISQIDNVNKQVNQIDRTVTEIKRRLDKTSDQTDQLEKRMRSNTEQITTQIETSGSFGFWTYFVLFQLMFGVAFMWWKKYRDDQNKKLY